MDTADRNYCDAMLYRAWGEALLALNVVEAFGLTDVAEKVKFAMDFLEVARGKLAGNGRNPDGTTGSARITSEGIELDPPKG